MFGPVGRRGRHSAPPKSSRAMRLRHPGLHSYRGQNPRLARTWVLLVAVIGMGLSGLAVYPTVASAAPVRVTNCNDSGPGSLREAVASANLGQTVNFNLPRRCSTITLASTIVINTNLTINGPGANALAVSGNHVVEVFDVSSGVTANISGLTIEDGVGGTLSGVSYGGGINNNGALTLTDSTVSGNTGPVGGGIESQGVGPLSIVDSTVLDNTSTVAGGGIANYSNATITDSTVTENSSYKGGGIHDGGGGTLTIKDSTISHNSASDSYYGGGLSNDNGNVDISNSTVADNGAGAGGGIYNIFGTTHMVNSTVAGNTGGALYNPQGTLSVAATVLANSISSGNCLGSITDAGYNLDDGGTCSFSASGDLSGPAGLDPMGLENNGGPTQTIALEPGSLAIGHVSNASFCPATDQRGFPRSVPCDIGAFQTQRFGVHRRRG